MLFRPLKIVITLFLVHFSTISASTERDCRDVSTQPKHNPLSCSYYHIVFVIVLNPVEYIDQYARMIREILTPCMVKNGLNKSIVSFINGPGSPYTTTIDDPFLFKDNYFYLEYTKDFDSSYNLFNLVKNFIQSMDNPEGYYTVIYAITNLRCLEIKNYYTTLFNSITSQQGETLITSATVPSRIIWTTAQTDEELDHCDMVKLRKLSTLNYFDYESNSLNGLLHDKTFPYRYGLCNFSGPMPTFEPSTDTTTAFVPSTTVNPTSEPWGHYVIYAAFFSALSPFICVAVFFILRRFCCPTWTPWRPVFRWINVHILRSKPKLDNYETRSRGRPSYNYPQFIGNGKKEKDDWEIEPLRLQITTEKLGEGAYAIVYKGVLKGTPPVMKVYPTMQLSFALSDIQNDVAVKMPPTTAREEEKKAFFEEIEFMKQLEYYPHLLSLLACSTDLQYPVLVTEYCERGDLLHLVREMAEKEAKEEDSLLFADLLPVSWQVSDALCFLSGRKIIHRDVAARNVLITKTKVAKLSDFGLCRYNNEMFYTTRGGKLPIKWMSPESIEYARFNEKTDVWSFGVFLFEVFSLGQTPYPSVQPEDMLEHLKEGNRLKTPDKMPEDVSQLMSICCEFLPDNRPDFSFIRQKLYKTMELDSNNDGYLQFHNNYYRLTTGIENSAKENEYVVQ